LNNLPNPLGLDPSLAAKASIATGDSPAVPQPLFHRLGLLQPSTHRLPGVSKKVKELLAKPLTDFSPAVTTHGVEPITHAALVLDKSISMSMHLASALAGFNAQVKVIREGAELAGRTLVSLNQFAGTSHMHYLAQPAQRLLPLEAAEYQTDGASTALLDAIGTTVEQLLEQPDIDGANTAILVSVFTDGQENSSCVYSASMLRELISRLEATGRWTFALMGPTGAALELADVLSLSRGNVSQFNPADVASTQEAFGAMTTASASYMSLRGAGMTSSVNLYQARGADEPTTD
jgi:hypothetical protein